MCEIEFWDAPNLTYSIFGWLIKEEATTLPEGFKLESSNIHHFMGAVDNFFHRHMVGINADLEKMGFQSIILKPNFNKAMDYAKGSYNSIYGEVKAEWRKINPNTYEYKVVIPANCEAQVMLPQKKQTVKSGEYTFTVNVE